MKIAFFANSDFYLFNFRLNLMKKLKKEGFEVFALAPITNEFFPQQLEKNEIIFLETPLKRGWGSCWGNFKYFLKVFQITRKYHFELIHNHTVKVNLLGSLAQKLAGAPLIICTIPGRGLIFSKNSLSSKIGQIFINFGYWLINFFVERFIFLNKEDQDYFLRKKILSPNKTVLIRSSGVDTSYFSPSAIDFSMVSQLEREIGKENKLVITFISRLLWQKGVGDFVKLAESFKDKYSLIFLLVGPLDQESPDGVPEKKIKEWESRGLVKYLGERREIREILYLTDIFVFPSVYGEGVPKVLLEAGAMERPLIAYDNIGSREVIDDGENGFLIEAKNFEKLKATLEKLILEGNLRKKFGQRTRQKIVEEFDENRVVEKTWHLYLELLER